MSRVKKQFKKKLAKLAAEAEVEKLQNPQKPRKSEEPKQLAKRGNAWEKKKDEEQEERSQRVNFKSKSKIEAAKRILSYSEKSIKNLLFVAQLNHCWNHVDWDYVIAELERKKRKK
jgi:hypothetical protein